MKQENAWLTFASGSLIAADKKANNTIKPASRSVTALTRNFKYVNQDACATNMGL
jgi:hypothetical protein